jgi:RNA polymerase sigma-70 factor (ECF subfamily)
MWTGRFVGLFRRRETKPEVPLEELADEDLFERYGGGDVRAFEVLLERHRKPVFNFVLRSVRSVETAEDLLQEVFLRLVRKAEGYTRRAKFTTWMYTIARNLCVDHARKMKHRNHASLDRPIGGGEDDGRTYLSLVAEKGPGPEGKLADQQIAGRLYAALEELPEEQREVFLMREHLDLKFREIAEIVGCPENTVKSRMRYALEFLRRELVDLRDGVAAEVEAVK